MAGCFEHVPGGPVNKWQVVSRWQDDVNVQALESRDLQSPHKLLGRKKIRRHYKHTLPGLGNHSGVYHAQFVQILIGTHGDHPANSRSKARARIWDFPYRIVGPFAEGPVFRKHFLHLTDNGP